MAGNVEYGRIEDRATAFGREKVGCEAVERVPSSVERALGVVRQCELCQFVEDRARVSAFCAGKQLNPRREFV